METNSQTVNEMKSYHPLKVINYHCYSLGPSKFQIRTPNAPPPFIGFENIRILEFIYSKIGK